MLLFFSVCFCFRLPIAVVSALAIHRYTKREITDWTQWHVCMYRWLPFVECPWDRVSNWVWGRGPSKVGPMSQHRGYLRSRVTHDGSYSHLMALSEPPLIWAAKVDLYPHIGGTVSNQAHSQIIVCYCKDSHSLLLYRTKRYFSSDHLTIALLLLVSTTVKSIEIKHCSIQTLTYIDFNPGNVE